MTYTGPVVLILTLFSQIPAKNNIVTRISGTAAGFQETSLVFFTYEERQFDTKKLIADIKIDPDGRFSFSFECPVPTPVYCETGTYTAYLLTESGREYTVYLPGEKNEGSPKLKNPYQDALLFHILPADSFVNGAKELNYSIRDFDAFYESFLDHQLIEIYDRKKSAAKIDSFIHSIAGVREVSDPQFLSEYICYRTAQLEIILGVSDYHTVSEKYVTGKPLALNNPAFWDLYKIMYDRHIRSLAGRTGFEDIQGMIRKEQYDSLALILEKDPLMLNDTIRDLVLLNELYEGFYTKDYPLSLSLNFTDTVCNRSSVSFIRKLSPHIRSSITSLQPGCFPPPFRLRNLAGTEYTPENFKGKYLLMGFCSIHSLGCLSEIEYLKFQHSRFHEFLQIILIVPQDEKDEAKAFIDLNTIAWQVMFDAGHGILSAYHIRTYPQFFLLDREGKLLLSPSPLPSENFEKILFNIMRSKGDI
jgi:peroxiredoxin